jgi:hypothetical protein
MHWNPERSMLLLALASACATAPSPANTAQATTPAAKPAAGPDCGAPIRGVEPIVEPGSITLFGEMHGTDAAPAMLGRLLCRAATEPGAKAVVLALEIPHTDQAQLDAALAAKDSSSARASLVAAGHFRDEWQDGRDTEAIVALVDRARTLRAAGLPIELLAFDTESTLKDARERDRRMAERLAESIAAHPGATVLVLSGNIHSRTKAGVPWDPEFVPMGTHLARRVPGVRALDIATAGGTSWMCMSPQPPPKLGIAMSPVSDEVADRTGYHGEGVLVRDVNPTGPAARAGLLAGDIIITRDGKPTGDIETFRRAIGEAKPRSKTKLELWRDGAKTTITCELGDDPPKVATNAPPSCGEHALHGEDRGAAPFIELFEHPDDNGHHGRWYVGPTRASPPAVAQASSPGP